MKVKLIGGAVVAAVVVGLLACAFVKYPPGDSASIAGWVQAIGSLAAIGLAIWLSELQAKRTADMQAVIRAERYGELYGPAMAIIQETVYRLQKVFKVALHERSQGAFNVDASFYDGRKALKQAFDGIPVHQMPTVASAASVLRVRELFIEADQLMIEIGAKFDNLLTVGPADHKAFDEHVSCWQTELNALRADLMVAAMT